MAEPEVSVVVIFLNEEEHLQEAIDSVLAQTFDRWELLLVDDGSTDAGPDIARAAVAADPVRVRYLQHDGGANRGMSASRNLGVERAAAPLIAYLDGDDVWLPRKLERQLALLKANPPARMVYGPLIRWRSWIDDPDGGRANLGERDDLYGIVGEHASVNANTLFPPVELVALFIRDKDLVPSGALFERSLFREVGGAEEHFKENYEDAVVFTKMCLETWAYCGPLAWYLYRQYPTEASDGGCAPRRSARTRVRGSQARARFVDWVEAYLGEQGVNEPRLDDAISEARRQMARDGAEAGTSAQQRLRRDVGRLPKAAKAAKNYLVSATKGDLRRIGVDDMTDEFAFSPRPGGWNHYTALLEDFDAAPGLCLDDTAFGRFFLHPEAKRVRDLNDLFGLGGADDRFTTLPRFWLGTYPWGGIAGDTVGTDGPAFGWAYDLETGAETSGLWGYGRTMWYEPGDRFTLNTQHRMTIELYRSIRRRYSPIRARGLPTVTVLRNGDGERRAVILDGHHRIAVLAHLGAKAISCEIEATIDCKDIDRWPAVAAGRCSRSDAQIFFDAFFELDGTERFDALDIGKSNDVG